MKPALIPRDLALSLGMDEDALADEGASPCALLCDVLGPTQGQDRWLALVDEATRLAEAQCPEGEIAAAVARSLDLAPELALACVQATAEALDVARMAAMAELRARVWGLAMGHVAASKEARADTLACAKQYLAFAGGPDARALADAIRAAERARGQNVG